MATLRIKGWRTGLRKVSMTQALQQYVGLSLAIAKRTTDSVLDGSIVDVAVEIDKVALFREILDQIGAEVTISDSPMSLTPLEMMVLDAYRVVANDPSSLHKQAETITIVSREHTGVGTFTHFKVEPSRAILQPISGAVSATKMVNLKHPELHDGACTVLFVKEGYIYLLELVAFGNEAWPTDETLFTVSMDDRNNQ